MAQTKNALIRQRVIDRCLRSPKQYSIMDMMEKCNVALEDAGYKPVTSKSTILEDLYIFNSISASPNKIKTVAKYEDVALALGRLMEGEFFTENEDIIRAVGLFYYFLSKAIKEGGKNPYLFVYRFSTTWEYNKAFYRLFAHSEGEEVSMSPFDIMDQSALMAYDHHLQGMQMADGLQGPNLVSLDPALGNIFRQAYSKYSATPKKQIVNLGNKYHKQIFDYLESKINNSDLVF